LSPSPVVIAYGTLSPTPVVITH